MSLKEKLRPNDKDVSPSGVNVTVSERKKVFEQDLSKKGVRNTRSGSFRAKKLDTGGIARSRQTSCTGLIRYRNVSHYDVQSMKVTTLATASTTDTNAKKATGASAAHYETGDFGDAVSNDLVASCPAFRNEIGGDEFVPGGIMDKLRKSLSHDKNKRVGTRMNMVLDGDIPNGDLQNLQTMGCHTAALFQRQAGIYHPFEFIDYGACYYRNHFCDQGKWRRLMPRFDICPHGVFCDGVLWSAAT